MYRVLWKKPERFNERDFLSNVQCHPPKNLPVGSRGPFTTLWNQGICWEVQRSHPKPWKVAFGGPRINNSSSEIVQSTHALRLHAPRATKANGGALGPPRGDNRARKRIETKYWPSDDRLWANNVYKLCPPDYDMAPPHACMHLPCCLIDGTCLFTS